MKSFYQYIKKLSVFFKVVFLHKVNKLINKARVNCSMLKFHQTIGQKKINNKATCTHDLSSIVKPIEIIRTLILIIIAMARICIMHF